MGYTLTEKILRQHLADGSYEPGKEIGIKIDQTLTQDATGTMAYLQFESMGLEEISTELSVSYVDHNTIQVGFENADDHAYLESIAKKYGIYFSRPGNGICHQVHLERFARPGKTLLGSDSHTPTAGGVGSIAIGAGGLDVAVAMGGGAYYLAAPRVINVRLEGRLQPWAAAKDVVLKVLSILSTRGNVDAVNEYTGPGVGTLWVPERATITNMGAALGVTTSVFPSDGLTRAFLKAQGREAVWRELLPDPDAVYDRIIEIDLGGVVPMVACPHSPDNVDRVSSLKGIKVDQVAIGSCTNSSYKDLVTVAKILQGRVAHPGVSFILAPGSRQVLANLAKEGYLTSLISSGARLMENACGFCIGNSQSPKSGAVSLRTSNRNFPGRSGTLDADVYLVSPETAAAAAHVPVAEIVDELLDGAAGAGGVVRLEAVGDGAHERVQLAGQPAVNVRARGRFVRRTRRHICQPGGPGSGDSQGDPLAGRSETGRADFVGPGGATWAVQCCRTAA